MNITFQKNHQRAFGTFPLKGDVLRGAIAAAVSAGYRAFDTAQMYGNEKGVGDGIREAGLDRSAVFITSKLNNGFHRPDDARRAFDETLRKLQRPHRLRHIQLHGLAARHIRHGNVVRSHARLGFLDPRDIVEGHAALLFRQQLGLGLAEAHGAASAALRGAQRGRADGDRSRIGRIGHPALTRRRRGDRRGDGLSGLRRGVARRRCERSAQDALGVSASQACRAAQGAERCLGAQSH